MPRMPALDILLASTECKKKRKKEAQTITGKRNHKASLMTVVLQQMYILMEKP